jgi:hypothetical protein
VIQRTGTVIDQARTRLAGGKPDSATRLVSLHDPDARPIVKGRLAKPIEFGYKAQIVDNADGIVLDHTVELATRPTPRSWHPQSNGSAAAPADHHKRSPPTAATARPVSRTIYTMPA